MLNLCCKKCCHCWSSISKKQILALTGAFLTLFLISHLIGNLLILKNVDLFNHYAETLISNPLLPFAEILLVIIFLLHILLGVRITLENRKARPTPYQYSKKSEGKKSFASHTMPISGLWILVFLILHIMQFKYGDHHTQTLGDLVIQTFNSPVYVAWYVISMIVIGLHLSHGIWSIFQTWGFNHPKYTPLIKKCAHILAWLIALGYISIPVSLFLCGGCS